MNFATDRHRFNEMAERFRLARESISAERRLAASWDLRDAAHRLWVEPGLLDTIVSVLANGADPDFSPDGEPSNLWHLSRDDLRGHEVPLEVLAAAGALIAAGADVDLRCERWQSTTPLMNAADNAHFALADLYSRWSEHPVEDAHGRTYQDHRLAMEGLVAAEDGDFSALDRLLAEGADGPLILSWLCAKGLETPIGFLLGRGVKPHSPGAYGEPPVLNALCAGRVDLARQLCEHGADPREADANGRTPAMWFDERDCPFQAEAARRLEAEFPAK